jgi:hypothetical protein
MHIRALSVRSPYERGGVKFDSRVLAWGDGRACVELDQVTLRRIGEAGLRELVQDPNIELHFPPEIGRHTHTESGPRLSEPGAAAAEAKSGAVTPSPVAQPTAGSTSRHRRRA